MKLVSRQLYLEAPERTFAFGNSFYTRGEGVAMMGTRGMETRSDLLDSLDRRFSEDNGRSWSAWEPIEVVATTDRGVRRRSPAPGWVDPGTGRMVSMVIDGILPSDNPLDGMKHYYMCYLVSTDGGRTSVIDEQIIQRGYTPDHPLEGVWVGKNSIFPGDITCRPIRTRAGEILAPVQTTPIGPDGEYYNPGGGYTYHESAVLIGRWRPDMGIDWELSQRVANDPARSARGAVEPTIAELPDGRILMVIRGSNDVKPHLPGYRWRAFSEDGGHTWGPIEPWTYTDGAPFHSPSSCSQLLRHSNGRYYWLGNLTPDNPRGNHPRYPLVIGEVDPTSGLLIRETVTGIDDRQSGEDAGLQLSCFMAHEDRETRQIVLHMTRFFANPWHGNAYQYCLEV